MLVRNEIPCYKLSIHRIEFSALSNADGGEKKGDRLGCFAESLRRENFLFESAVTR
jgi:hypothetical protein